MSESIFDIDLIKEGYHVFSLVSGVIDFFNTIEDHTQNYFMGHYTCIIKKISIALLNTFYC